MSTSKRKNKFKNKISLSWLKDRIGGRCRRQHYHWNSGRLNVTIYQLWTHTVNLLVFFLPPTTIAQYYDYHIYYIMCANYRLPRTFIFIATFAKGVSEWNFKSVFIFPILWCFVFDQVRIKTIHRKEFKS